MKLIVNNLLIILIFNFISPCLGYSTEICFSENSAKQLTVDLEEASYQKNELILSTQKIELLTQEVNLLKTQVDLQLKQLTILMQTIDDYKTLVKTQQEQYTKIIEENKPSTIKMVLNMVGAVAAGFVMGLILH